MFKTRKIFTVILAAVCIFALCLSGCGKDGAAEKTDGGNTPEMAAEKYMRAAMDFDWDGMKESGAIDLDVAMNEMFAAYAGGGLPEDDITEALMREFGTADMRELLEGPVKERSEESLTAEYGTGRTLTVKSAGISDLSKEEMDEELSSVRRVFESYGIDPEKVIKISGITDMCRVEADAAIKGSIKEETLRADWLCVKVNGKWKVLDDAESLFAAFVWD